MSTLKADTIQNTSGGAATFTKQEAVKFWTNYDAINQTTDGSLNQSSLTDQATGRFYSSFTSSFSSTTDKCVLLGIWNTIDDGSNSVASGQSRGMMKINQGAEGTGSLRAGSTSEVQFATTYGSDAVSNGGTKDASGNYVAQLGDLA